MLPCFGARENGERGIIMCFRPPDAKLKPLKCPDCGKRINNPNYRPERCPFCDAFLPAELDGMDKYIDAPSIPSPGAPGTPQPPQVGKPGAPQAPPSRNA